MPTKFDKYKGKVISTRLPEDALAYFLKFGQKHGTSSVSATVLKMIDILEEVDSLDDITLKDEPFEEAVPYNREFISTTEEKDKQTIILRGEKLPKKEEEDKDEDEDVFTI